MSFLSHEWGAISNIFRYLDFESKMHATLVCRMWTGICWNIGGYQIRCSTGALDRFSVRGNMSRVVWSPLDETTTVEINDTVNKFLFYGLNSNESSMLFSLDR